MKRRLRKVALALAGAAGTMVRTMPGIIGAVCVVVGVAFQEHAGHGLAWMVAGGFLLLAAYEQNSQRR